MIRITLTDASKIDEHEICSFTLSPAITKAFLDGNKINIEIGGYDGTFVPHLIATKEEKL